MEKLTEKCFSTNHKFYHQPSKNFFHLIKVSRFFHIVADIFPSWQKGFVKFTTHVITGLDFDKYFLLNKQFENEGYCDFYITLKVSPIWRIILKIKGLPHGQIFKDMDISLLTEEEGTKWFLIQKRKKKNVQKWKSR